MITSNFIRTDQTTKLEIYKALDVDESQVKRDIQIIKDWMKQQPHLSQEVADDFIEIWLIRNKFRVEETKVKIDKHFGCKAIGAGEVAKIRPILPSDIQECIVAPLPQLTDKLERILVLKMRGKNIISYEDIVRSFKTILCTNEYSLQCDFSLKYRIIYDLSGFEHDTFLNCVKLQNSSIVKPYINAYFARIAGVEFLNVPSFLETIYKSVKSTIANKIYKEKILDRIHFHKDLDSLHKNIGKQYLPVEYGGELKTSLEELHESWNDEIKNNLDVLEKLVVEQISDESKRVGELKYDEFFGVNGTFKTLSID